MLKLPRKLLMLKGNHLGDMEYGESGMWSTTFLTVYFLFNTLHLLLQTTGKSPTYKVQWLNQLFSDEFDKINDDKDVDQNVEHVHFVSLLFCAKLSVI